MMAALDGYPSLVVAAKIYILITAMIATLSFIPAVVGQHECENVSLSATETASYFSSPNYPMDYPSCTDCQWRISATSSDVDVVVLTLLDFDLQGSSPNCSNGYVAIYDGYDSSFPRILKLCGNDSFTQVASFGSFMTVVFHSDCSTASRGFKFKYTAKNKSVLCGNTTLLARDTPKYITSPGYPNNYPSNMNCHWLISTASVTQVVVLKLLDFNLEGTSPSCLHDNVTIYNGYSSTFPRIRRLCGLILSTQLTSTGPYMTVVFNSDGSTELEGFQFEYTSHNSSDVDLTATKTAQYIISPNYPNNYSSITDCQWRISAGLPSQVIVLKLLDFILEEPSVEEARIFDYVTIYDGPSQSFPRIRKLSGQQSVTQFTSTGSYMTVVFHSDGSNNFRGFKFEYIKKNNSIPCVGATLFASSDVNYLTSPNYPYPHPSEVNCQWHIKTGSDSSVVEIKVTNLNLAGNPPNCTSVYVKIYDGSNAGSCLIDTLCSLIYYDKFESTGSDMTVVFHSEGENSYHTGFKIAYQSKSTDSSGLVSSGTIIAIGACGVVATALLIVYLMWVKRRMRKSLQSRASSSRRGNSLFPGSHMINNQAANSAPNGEGNSQSIFDPPPYSSLNFNVKDCSVSYIPRSPSKDDLPPPYSSDMPGGISHQGQTPLHNDPRPGASYVGLESNSGGDAHVNSAFSLSSSEEASGGHTTD